MSREDFEDKAEFGNDEVEKEEELENEELSPSDNPARDESESDGQDESDSSEEDDEEEDDKLKGFTKPKRDKTQTRINILQRERYRALNELEKKAAEVEFWKQKAELSSQASMRQLDSNVNYRLDKAKAAQIAAIESGDTQAQVDAMAEVAAATAELHEVNNWKYQDDYEKRARQYQQQEPDYQPDPEILNAWYHDNSDWIDPSSKRYDRELVEYMGQADTWLANQLRAAGRHREIGGSDYLQEIENMKEQFIQHRNQSTNQRRELNMRQPRGGASPVRNSGHSTRRPSIGERLTSEQQALAKTLGNQKVYEQEVARFRKEQQEEELASRRRW
jgi:hypothetical protein